MNASICPICGKTSYSAAQVKDLFDKRCPYCGALLPEEQEVEHE